MKNRTWVVVFALAFAASIAIPAISGEATATNQTLTGMR